MIKKHTGLYLLLALVLLTLPGCLRVDQEIWHNPDGSGKLNLDMGISIDFLNMISSDGQELPNPLTQWEQMKTDPAQQENIVKLETRSYDDQGLRHYAVDVELKDMTKIGDESRSAADFKLEKLSNGNYRFSQTIDLGAQSAAQQMSNGDVALAMKDKYWRVTLHVPRVISSDPRAKVDEAAGTVSWELPMARIVTAQEPTELWLEYSLRKGLPAWAWAAGAAALLLLGLGAWFFLKNKKRA